MKNSNLALFSFTLIAKLILSIGCIAFAISQVSKIASNNHIPNKAIEPLETQTVSKSQTMKIIQDSFTGAKYTAGKLEVSFPEHMKVGTTYPITIKVSRSHIFIVAADTNKRLEIFDVMLSPKIAINVYGDDFKVTPKPHSSLIQHVAPENKTVTWDFDVMPLSTGMLTLKIKVGNVSDSGDTISYYQNEDKLIHVNASYTIYKALLYKTKLHYLEYMWLYNLLATIFSVFGISQYFQRRK